MVDSDPLFFTTPASITSSASAIPLPGGILTGLIENTAHIRMSWTRLSWWNRAELMNSVRAGASYAQCPVAGHCAALRRCCD